MSIFKRLRSKVDEHANFKAAADLALGKQYVVFSFKQRKSMFIDKTTNDYPINLVAHVRDGAHNYFTTLPNLYNNLKEEEVEEMNATIKCGKPPFIVFYGKIGTKNDVLIHEFGEEVDVKRLEENRTAAAVAASASDASTSEESPAKKLKK